MTKTVVKIILGGEKSVQEYKKTHTLCKIESTLSDDSAWHPMKGIA